MSDFVQQLLYLSAVLVAVGFAFGMPKRQRRAGVLLAVSVLANWLFIQWTYTAYSPMWFLKQAGLPIKFLDLWMLADAVVGLVAISAAWRWWFGWTIWAIVLVQELVYFLYQQGLDQSAMLTILDKTLLAMVAVFLFAGGPGVWNFLRRCLGGGSLHGGEIAAQGSPRETR